MPTGKDVYDAEDLLETLLARTPKEYFRSELREAVFLGAATVLGFVVDPAMDAIYIEDTAGRLHIEAAAVRRAIALPYAMHLRSFANGGDGRGCASVVGIHFVDPELGRLSGIWIPPQRPCPGLEGEGAAAGSGDTSPRGWGRFYPDLWLRVYKRLLHPSTSLLNAFESELLKWPGRGILVDWRPDLPAAEGKRHEAAKGKASRTGFKRVGIRRDSNGEFIRATEAEVARVHAVLLGACRGSVPAPDSPAFEALADSLSREIERKCIVTTLQDIRETYLQRLLVPGEAQDAFLSILEDLGGPAGRILTGLKTASDWRLRHDVRRQVMEGVEVLQTVLFNAPGFCSDHGLLLERQPIDRSHVYLLLGADGAFEPDLENYHELGAAFRLTLDAATEVIRKAEKLPRGERDDGDQQIVGRLVSGLHYLSDRGPDRGPSRFLHIAIKLSREAIHEGRQLKFLLGFGHAETPELRCRHPLRPLDHLAGEGVDHGLVVHFIKSYFSLFEREDAVLWFDEAGRFHGLYSRAPQDPQEHWLRNWGERCYFARIEGKQRLDILELDAACNEHRPRFRVVGDTISDLQSMAAVRYMVTLASAATFKGTPAIAEAMSKLIWRVADRLREDGHGAGVVVSNADSNAEGDWRVSIGDQLESLVPDLPHFNEPLASLGSEDFDERLDDIVVRLCELAALDGALHLDCAGGELKARPARHFFPLILATDGDGKKHLELLSFYRWAEDGAQIVQAGGGRARIDAVAPTVESVINAIPRDDLRHVEASRVSSRALEAAKRLEEFKDVDDVRVYTACIAGRPRELRALKAEHGVRRMAKSLSFLTSSGTRHHSLWGITMSSRQRMFVVTLSQDGRVSVFWDGRLIPSPGLEGRTT